MKGCSVDGCERKHTARGLCKYHYYKDWYNPLKRKDAPPSVAEIRAERDARGVGFCSKCNVEKPLAEMLKPRVCKACWNTHARDKYAATNGYRDKNRYVQRTWGISLVEYEARRNAAGGCEICGAQHETSTLNLDHHHATGKLRGFLCVPCNTALGGFKENPTLLRAAIEYLERHAHKDGDSGGTTAVLE